MTKNLHVIPSKPTTKGLSAPDDLISLVTKLVRDEPEFIRIKYDEKLVKKFVKNFALNRYGELVAAIKADTVSRILYDKSLNEQDKIRRNKENSEINKIQFIKAKPKRKIYGQ